MHSLIECISVIVNSLSLSRPISACNEWASGNDRKVRYYDRVQGLHWRELDSLTGIFHWDRQRSLLFLHTFHFFYSYDSWLIDSHCSSFLDIGEFHNAHMSTVRFFITFNTQNSHQCYAFNFLLTKSAMLGKYRMSSSLWPCDKSPRHSSGWWGIIDIVPFSLKVTFSCDINSLVFFLWMEEMIYMLILIALAINNLFQKKINFDIPNIPINVRSYLLDIELIGTAVHKVLSICDVEEINFKK